MEQSPELRVVYRGRSHRTHRRLYRVEERLPSGAWTCLASGDRNEVRRALLSRRPSLRGEVSRLLSSAG
ncbi:MAG: hypothetical protein ACHQ1G_00025 [Planctomycetota bacterium]